MNLQAFYEIEVAEDLLEDRLEREVTPRGDVAAYTNLSSPGHWCMNRRKRAR